MYNNTYIYIYCTLHTYTSICSGYIYMASKIRGYPTTIVVNLPDNHFLANISGHYFREYW